MIVFETARLIVRRWTEDDTQALFAIFGDPETYRFLPGVGPVSLEQARQLLARLIDQYERFNGMGAFAAEIRETGQVIGNCLLRPLEDGPEIEVGYHIARQLWGKGYATEIARGAVEWGFQVLGLTRIVGVVMPGNGASRRVLEKAGLQWDRTGVFFGLECDHFVIERSTGAGD